MRKGEPKGHNSGVFFLMECWTGKITEACQFQAASDSLSDYFPAMMR